MSAVSIIIGWSNPYEQLTSFVLQFTFLSELFAFWYRHCRRFSVYFCLSLKKCVKSKWVCMTSIGPSGIIGPKVEIQKTKFGTSQGLIFARKFTKIQLLNFLANIRPWYSVRVYRNYKLTSQTAVYRNFHWTVELSVAMTNSLRLFAADKRFRQAYQQVYELWGIGSRQRTTRYEGMYVSSISIGGEIYYWLTMFCS